jgi:nucleoside-diphosphate-sugar epimerase
LKILLTGASGFIGSALLKSLSHHHVNLIGRRKFKTTFPFYTKELNESENYEECLSNVDVVIHAAARAHIIRKKLVDFSTEYHSVNTKGTLNLARQAASLAVKRFIYLSSIGVNGNASIQPFTELDKPAPHNHYALSKHEAEIGLLNIAIKSGMEVVIIRPPLVYGPNPPGNFASLINTIKKGYPLPLANLTQNKRSLVALENLVDFILLCTDYNKTPQAANQTFVISDGEDVSTAELFHRVAKAYGKKNHLLPFPVPLLRLAATLLGKQAIADSLLDSLQVDSSKARELLGWKPVVTMDEQLLKMARADISLTALPERLM